MKNGDPVSKLFSFLQVLGGQEYRCAATGELFNNFPNLDTSLGIQPGSRLIEENKLRVSNKAHGYVEPAAHASRISSSPAICSIGEAKAVQ